MEQWKSAQDEIIKAKLGDKVVHEAARISKNFNRFLMDRLEHISNENGSSEQLRERAMAELSMFHLLMALITTKPDPSQEEYDDHSKKLVSALTRAMEMLAAADEDISSIIKEVRSKLP